MPTRQTRSMRHRWKLPSGRRLEGLPLGVELNLDRLDNSPFCNGADDVSQGGEGEQRQ